MVRQHADDEGDRRLLADVERHGWHLVGIEDAPEGPGYVFSVGMYHTLGQPEIAMFGLNSVMAMEQIINLIGEEMRAGTSFEDWRESDTILEGYSCMFRRVDPEWYARYFGYALWFYEGPHFPMLQCLWPDREHRYPWDAGCDRAAIERQPDLAVRDGWRFSAGKNRAVFTTRSIVEEGRPVLLVTHDEEGDWQFLGGAANDLADGRLVSLETVVKRHPSVTELADLPRGWRAERNDAADAWRRKALGE